MLFALVRLLAGPYLRRHTGRYLLLLCGVALAVGVYASMHLANGAVKEAFWTATDRLAGSAHLQITAGDAGVPEAALDRAREVPCVNATAGLIIRVLSTGVKSEGGLALLGIDLLDEPRFREYRMDGAESAQIDDALVFLAQPDSVLVTRDFARRNGLDKGSDLAVWTGRERRALKIRGFLANEGALRAYGGNAVVMDVYAAQHTFGRRGFFDRIDLSIQEGEDPERCRNDVARAVGSHVRVDPPPSRGRSVHQLSKTYLLLVESSALLGMLIAMFLVHHAGATSVAQREREIAILLGLGVCERAVARLVLIESAVLGCAGASLGILAGAAGARSLGAALGKLLESAFGVSLEVEAAPVDVAWALLTVAAASLLCAGAAFAPARSAAAVSPIQLMEARRFSGLAERRRWALPAAFALCAGALLWQAFDSRLAILYATIPLVTLAFGLAAGALAPLVLSAIRPIFVFLLPLEGRLAVDGLLRSAPRTRGALTGLSLTVATVLALTGLTASYADSIRRWTRQLVNPDFLIHSNPNIAGKGALYPGSMAARLEQVPGVDRALPIRRFWGEAEGTRTKLVTTQILEWSRHNGISAARPDDGALVSRNFANTRRRFAGDTVRISSPTGAFELQVKEVIDDFSSELGSVYVDWRVYRQRFADDSAEMFGVFLKPGASRPAVRKALLERMDAGAPALILDGNEFRSQLDRIVARWRGIGFVQIAVALALSLVGVGSFLVVSISAQRRELGILSMLGATPAQTAKCVLAEAAAIALAAIVLGGMLGAALNAYLLFTLRSNVNGFDLPMKPDLAAAAALIVVLPIGALVATLPPLRALDRMNLVREVETDA